MLFVTLFAGATLIWRCNKNSSANESILYGTWIKGTNTGDTLHFLQKNGKNILAYNEPAPTEVEYIYNNGKLMLKNYPASATFSPIQSFVWKQFSQEFEIQGIELFIFMSSTNVYFTYHKI